MGADTFPCAGTIDLHQRLERNVGPAVAESSGYCCPSTPDLALTT